MPIHYKIGNFDTHKYLNDDTRLPNPGYTPWFLLWIDWFPWWFWLPIYPLFGVLFGLVYVKWWIYGLLQVGR